MANNCFYDMHVVGRTKESVDRVYDILIYRDSEFFVYRCFCCDVYDEAHEDDGYWVCGLCGDVAWGISEWINMDQPSYSMENGSVKRPLQCICKALGVGIEIWAEEEGMGYQEHYVVTAGGLVKDRKVFTNLPFFMPSDDFEGGLKGGFDEESLGWSALPYVIGDSELNDVCVKCERQEKEESDGHESGKRYE